MKPILKFSLHSVVLPRLVTTVAIVLCCYSSLSLALGEGDTVRELAGLTTETTKIVKNGCYIAGTASALVGAIWAVASQSLKVAASSAAITIVALKAAGFFTAAAMVV